MGISDIAEISEVHLEKVKKERRRKEDTGIQKRERKLSWDPRKENSKASSILGERNTSYVPICLIKSGN